MVSWKYFKAAETKKYESFVEIALARKITKTVRIPERGLRYIYNGLKVELVYGQGVLLCLERTLDRLYFKL